MAPVLQVADLAVSYDDIRVVRDVSFEIHSGEVLAVVGESGSGKSTLAMAIPRLLERVRISGRITLQRPGSDGMDLLKASERELNKVRGRQISMIFQEPMSSLNPISRVGNQIEEAIFLHRKMSAHELREKAVSLLAITGIVDPERCLKSYPHELSGGQCQRVGIAMALANHPSLIIADEPTTALDVTVQAQIVNCLDSLRRAREMSILFITHDLGLVRRFADRVLVMYAGEIVESGSVTEVFAHPRMPYTAALLASRPRFDNAGVPIPLEPVPGSPVSMEAIPRGCCFHPRCRHMKTEVCCAQPISLRSVAVGHQVRCTRWREIQ